MISSQLSPSDSSSDNIQLKIASYVFLTFIGYLIIGYSLAFLPVFIHRDLKYSAVTAGLIISIQYAATFLFRGIAGNIVDKKGPKLAVQISMVSFVISGVLLTLAGIFSHQHHLSILFLVLTRLIAGCGEGMVGASPVNWAMLSVGDEHTATAISYNGIASYGAMAVGAPLGVLIGTSLGVTGLGIAVVCSAIFGFLYANRKKALKETKEATERHSFLKVFGIVSPYGTCLALGGMGFGTISTFITLYYQYQKWDNGALCLTVFGGLFVLARIVFSNAINRFGGMKVGIASLAFEVLGLLVLWMADSAIMGLIGAGLTGLGFSLVFPAMGVEAVKLVPPSNKGAALAAYGVFIDISLGITGPLVGLVIDNWGMQNIFEFSSVMVFVGLGVGLVTYWLGNRRARFII